jgi:hypothetical protein
MTFQSHTGRSTPRRRRTLADIPGHVTRVAAAAVLLVAGGCTLGPSSVQRDRVSYGEALAQSTREELLRNIVRLRYLESPAFLNVASVVTSYSITTDLRGGGNWNITPVPTSAANASGGISINDRPTISYSPMGGADFAKAYLRPIPLDAVLALLQSGAPVNFLAPRILQTINESWNADHSGVVDVEADATFVELIALLARMQDEGEVLIHSGGEEAAKSGAVAILTLRSWGTPESDARVNRARELLLAEAGQMDFRVMASQGRPEKGNVNMTTRTMLQVLTEASSYVEVPPEEVAAGIVRRGMPDDANILNAMIIHSGPMQPDDAYVAVKHRGRWFWIDDDDPDAKQEFLSLVIMTTLANAQDRATGPILTIPTSG